MNKKTIALIAGGYSGEYEISIKTAATIQQHIDSLTYTSYLIILSKDGWYCHHHDSIIKVDKNDFSIQIEGKKILFDAAFIAVHGTPGEDGKLQGYLDMMNIPYTSCDAIVSALTFNKVYCNRVVASADLVKVAKSLHIVKERALDTDTILQQLTLPIFVKPAEGGSSLATTKVKEASALQPALSAVFAISSQAIVEEYVKGREFSVGVYRTKNGMTVYL
jgi:D-alanine-D-alanine ligase and related ATP-grasp enzymes